MKAKSVFSFVFLAAFAALAPMAQAIDVYGVSYDGGKYLNRRLKGYQFTPGAETSSTNDYIVDISEDLPDGWDVSQVFNLKRADKYLYLKGKAKQRRGKELGVIADATCTWSSDTEVTISYLSGFATFAIIYGPVSYEISFDANGGSGYMEPMTGISYTNSTRRLTKNAFALDGYRFAGWLVDTNDLETVFADESVVDGAGYGVLRGATNVTLYAKWATIDYNVVYDENGGNAGASRPKTASYLQPFLVSAPTKKGYTFAGWTLEEGYAVSNACYGVRAAACTNSIPADTGFVAVTNDVYFRDLAVTNDVTVTLRAEWAKSSSAISYVDYGDDSGSSDGKNLPTVLDYDVAYLVPAPSKAGYKFVGWQVKGYDPSTACYGSNEDCANPVPNGGLVRVTTDIYFKNLSSDGSSISLTAQWQPIAYDIVYDENGGNAGASRPKTADYDAVVCIDPPTKAGATFKGWKVTGWNDKTAYYGLNSTACGRQVPADGEIDQQTTIYIKNFTPEDGGLITFAAIWSGISYSVVYDLDGGSAATANPTAMECGSVIRLNAPKKANYVFAGWKIADYDKAAAVWGARADACETPLADSDGVIEATGDVYVRDLSTTASSSVKPKLTALWKECVYTVTFDANGGLALDEDGDWQGSVAKSYPYDATYGAFPATTNLSGKLAFVGWYTDPEVGTKVAASAKVTATTTLYARWSSATYAIAFDANGGTGTTTGQTAAFDADVTLRANAFKREGYSFAGWATTPDATAAEFKDRAVVRDLAATSGETVTLYAVWSAADCTVTFVALGSTKPWFQLNYKYGAAYGELPVAVNTNATQIFIGWFTSVNTGVQVTETDVVTNTATKLYAHWGAGDYSISFDANGGTGTMNALPANYDAEVVLTKNAFARTGYSFLGWATSADATSALYKDEASVKNLGTVTLYAVWKPYTYTVAFAKNGGAGSVANKKATYDVAFALPAADAFTAPKNKEFAGWRIGGTTYKAGASVKNLTAVDGATVTVTATWSTTLSDLAKAMDSNLDWENFNTSASQWRVCEDEGYESSSCARQENANESASRSPLCAELTGIKTNGEYLVKGKLTFMWKLSDAKAKLQWGITDGIVIKPKEWTSVSSTEAAEVPGSKWRKVSIEVELPSSTSPNFYFILANVTAAATNTYECIDQMKWVSAFEDEESSDGGDSSASGGDSSSTAEEPVAGQDEAGITNLSVGTDGLTLTITNSQSKFSYRVLYKTSLSEDWKEGMTFGGFDGSMTIKVAVPEANKSCFYTVETVKRQ